MEGDTRRLVKTFLVRPAIIIGIAAGAYFCAKCNSQKETGGQTMNKTLKDYVTKLAKAAGLAAALASCPTATAQEKDLHSFDKVGTRTRIVCTTGLADQDSAEITAVYAADLDGDGDSEIIIGTKNCGVYTLENKVKQKQIGEK